MIHAFNRYIPLKYVLIFFAEHAVLLVCGYLAIALRSIALHAEFDPATIGHDPTLFWRVFLITIVCQLCLAYNQLYTQITPPVGVLLTRLFQSFAVAWGMLFVIYFLLPGLETGRPVFLFHLSLSPLFIALGRLGFADLLNRGEFREKVLIVGSGHLAKLVGRHLMTHHDPGFEVIGFIDQDPARIGAPVINPRVIGIPEQIPAIVRAHNVRKVIIALPERRGRLPLDPLLACKVAGIEVLDGLSFYERLTGKIVVEGLNPGWLIFSEGFSRQRLTFVTKRIIDVLCAGVGLILSAPLLAMFAILIKLDSKGPILYRQVRVGEGQRLFTLLKLRSMQADAEAKNGPVWAMKDDPRATRVGKIIRKLRIDELPQIINVLRGEMSFVGPRPERPEFVATLADKVPYYNLRHSVKPGITGWAQIRYQYGASVEDAVEKMHYDLYYIKNLSLGLDLLVFFETARIMLLGKGAR
jgi:sugar transferase (PEP-CTERM system associated)